MGKAASRSLPRRTAHPPRRTMRSVLPPLCLLLLLAPPAVADDGLDFFERKVRPVLAENCYPCHSVAAGKQRGGLSLDTREAVRKGGDHGPAVVPGKPQDSLLVQAVRQTGKLKMPPRDKLPDAVVADLEEWVKQGAPDP